MTVTEQVTVTVYGTETVIEVQKVATVEYETVPVDTGTSIIYVTNPVLTLMDVEVTRSVQIPVQEVRTVTRQVAFERESFARTLDIRVSNSTQANQLIITTTPNGGSGQLDVGSVIVNGDLGRLIASTTLDALRVEGYLGSVNLEHLGGPMVTAGTPRHLTSLEIDQIEGNITTGSSISRLTSQHVGLVNITAPRINQLIVRRSPTGDLAGDFNASLTLDAGFRSTLALGSASIDGNMTRSFWNIRGSIGSVVVLGTVQEWYVGPLFGGAFDDLRTPTTVGNIQSLRLRDVRDASIYADGRIGSLTAASWEGYTIQARTLGTLNVSGQFSANLSLDAGLSTALALSPRRGSGA